MAGFFIARAISLASLRTVVANRDAKVKTLADLVECGKREPGAVFYGTAGVGSPLYIGVRMPCGVSRRDRRAVCSGRHCNAAAPRPAPATRA